MRVAWALRVAAWLALLFVAAEARATEPWIDQDPSEEPTRQEFGAYGLTAGLEYRANFLYINPIALTGRRERRVSYIEQRLRLDFAADYDEKVKVAVSLDALDGTLWGDNGTFGGTPSTNSGARVDASNPNLARPVVGYKGGDVFDPSSYGYVLAPVAPVFVRRAYGDVLLPIGLLRIGRQPAIDGMSLLFADGDGRTNRFGYANVGDSADRVLFATKPLEAWKPNGQRDRAADRGLLVAVFYDHVAANQVSTFGDDLHGAGTLVRFSNPDPRERRDLRVELGYMHRWEADFDTSVNTVDLQTIATVDRLSIGAEGALSLGATREVSDAYARILGSPVTRQDIRQWGARGVARWDEPLFTAYLELDYASGDGDPAPNSPLTQFYWSEDNNVGLLMFERVLSFASARSAASGVALLRTLGARTFPAERVDTEGSFTNAVAVFPQLDLKPVDDVLFRAGVLAAWAPDGVVDPITSLRRRSQGLGNDVTVNFAGGKPGSFYGVELDGRFQWRFEDRFIFDLESAVLFPGDAFEDASGRASKSFLVQARTTFAL